MLGRPSTLFIGGTCGNGHVLTEHNVRRIPRRRAGEEIGGEWLRCRECQKKHNANNRKKAKGLSVSREPRRLPIRIGATPAQMAAARVEYEAWLATTEKQSA